MSHTVPAPSYTLPIPIERSTFSVLGFQDCSFGVEPVNTVVQSLESPVVKPAWFGTFLTEIESSDGLIRTSLAWPSLLAQM